MRKSLVAAKSHKSSLYPSPSLPQPAPTTNLSIIKKEYRRRKSWRRRLERVPYTTLHKKEEE